MKKVLSVAIAMAMMLSFAACSEEKAPATETPSAPVETPAAPSAPAETPAAPVEEKAELTAKTLEECTEEIKAAGAVEVTFTNAADSMTVDVVMAAEATAEDVAAVNDVVKALMSDEGFVAINLFEGKQEKGEKVCTINYILGEGEAAYRSTAGYSSNSGRKGWLFTCNNAWSGPKAVEAAE